MLGRVVVSTFDLLGRLWNQKLGFDDLLDEKWVFGISWMEWMDMEIATWQRLGNLSREMST